MIMNSYKAHKQMTQLCNEIIDAMPIILFAFCID